MMIIVLLICYAANLAMKACSVQRQYDMEYALTFNTLCGLSPLKNMQSNCE